MLLEPLVSVLAEVKERLERHDQELRQSEALTRSALIDPVLRALGWNTEDPNLARPEYAVSDGKADYALLSPEGKAVVIVEVKSLGRSLEQDRELDQLLRYAFADGIPYGVLTNGNNWHAYDLKIPGVAMKERRIMETAIADAEPYQCALQLLYLWRPNLASGQPVPANVPPTPVAAPIAPPTPAYAPPEPASAAPIHMADAPLPVAPYQPPAPVPPTPVNEAGWRPLTSISYEQGDKSPVGIRFNQANAKILKSWLDAWVQVCEWAVANGWLTAAYCPMPSPTGQGVRVIVNTVAEHPPSGRNPGGRGFKQPRKISNGLFIETNYNPTGSINNAKFLLERVGVNPAVVELRFE